jgi:hypothetical protein
MWLTNPISEASVWVMRRINSGMSKVAIGGPVQRRSIVFIQSVHIS